MSKAKRKSGGKQTGNMQASNKRASSTNQPKNKPGGSQTSKKKAQSTSKINRWAIIGIAGVALLVLGFYLIGWDRNAQSATPDEITVQQAAARRDAGAFILDVRTQEEWEQVHIPGATLIPLDQLEDRVNEVPRDKEVVVVCRSGNRSQEGRDILRKAGIAQAVSMKGGVKDWQAAGLETVSGK